MAGKVAPNIVTSGLVLYLDAANPESYVSGSTAWNDISRSGVNGTLVSGSSFSSANGGSIVFDGVNDYGVLSSSSIWAFGNNGTVSTWCLFTGSLTTNSRIWCVNNNSSSLDAYISFQSPVGVLGMHGAIVRTVNQFPTSSWTHVTATYNQGTLEVYFNSIPQALSGNATGYNITNSNPLFLGKYTAESGFRWRGNLAITQIYNRALSATEVLQNYNATKTRFGL